MNRRTLIGYTVVIAAILSMVIILNLTFRAASDQVVEPAAEDVAATPVAITPSPSPTASAAAIEAQIDESYPLNEFPPHAPIVVAFSRPMDRNHPQPLVISRDISGVFQWNESATSVAFIPDEPFTPGSRFSVVVNESLTGAAGERLAETVRWPVWIAQPPSVVRRTPLAREIADLQPTLQLRFNRAMDEDSVVEALTIEPPLSFDAGWDGHTLLIEISEPLAFGADYVFTIGRSASDANGIPLAEEIQWRHQLSDVLAHVAGPTRRNPLAPIALHFNYPIDSDTAGLPEIDPPIPGPLSWNDDKTTLTITPEERLMPDTDYAIRLPGPLRHADGFSLPLPEPVTLTTPPVVIATNPGGNNASPIERLEIVFDREVDRASAEAALEIEPAIEGVVSWEENTLIFWPAIGYWQEESAYRVTLAAAVRDPAGQNLMRRPYEWSFQTRALASGAEARFANFGVGPNGQVVDVTGRRAVQFQINSARPVRLNFELYALSIDQFLIQYSQHFTASWQLTPIMDVSDFPLAASWQTETTAARRDWANVQETLIPDDIPAGLYLLQLNSVRPEDQLFLILTENNLVVKRAGEQLLAWLTNINGDVAGGVPVSVYAEDGRLLRSGQTDSRGLFETALPPDETPMLVAAGQGDNLTVSGLSGEWAGAWGWTTWRAPSSPLQPGRAHAVYIYTDRPIYRPGHEVFFKAIVRRDDDANLEIVAPDTPVTAHLRDARDNLVESVELATNAFGSAHGAFQLGDEIMLGYYHIEIEIGEEGYRQAFQVEAYRAPDVEVALSTDAAAYIAGQPIDLTVAAHTFFGEPVANAEVEIRRFTRQQPPYYYRHGAADPPWFMTGDSVLTQRTGDDGHTSLTVPTRERLSRVGEHFHGSNLVRESWGLEATVNDGSNQTISGFTIVEVYSVAEEIDIRTDNAYQTPGEPFTVAVSVADAIDQTPVAGRYIEVEVKRWAPDGRSRIRAAGPFPVTTDANGQAQLTITLENAGYYELYAEGEDRLGNLIAYNGWLYLFEGGAPSWHRSRNPMLAISADQTSYAPGDTAQLLIESEFGGPALLTFERGQVRREQLITLTPPFTEVEIPIVAQDAPNIHVVVNSWEPQDTALSEHTYHSLSDSRLRQASVNLHAPPVWQELQVTISSDRESYAPGEEAVLDITVTNAAGVPVSAEVSLALVDEAIFALREELVGPIFDGFYFPRANQTLTYNSMALERMLGGGGLGGGNGGLGGGLLRRDFQDTAVWLPNLVTDANGQVSATVTLPDNVTRWRATARAVTADTQVGETTHTIVSRKDILIRPILPRHLTAGDTVYISGLAQNYSDQPVTLTVTAWVSSSLPLANAPLTLDSPAVHIVTLQPDETQIVGWTAEATAAGEAQLIMAAVPHEAGLAGDGALSSLSIQPLAVLDTEVTVGQFTGQTNLEIFMPGDAGASSSLEIHLSRSIAGNLLEGLEYLTGFPYGCVEQTMSKALPNAVIGRALQQLGVEDPELETLLPRQIRVGLQRLYGYQQENGGWGWWYDDAPQPYQTAWVLFGLAMTAEAGYQVDAGVMERGAAWLSEQLDDMDANSRAFALYSLELAGYGRPADTARLYGQVEDLDTFGQSALALTLHNQGESGMARSVVEILAESATTMADGRVYWNGEAGDGAYRRRTMASSTRNTAIALSAFSQIQPGHPLESGAVRWLMNQRQIRGWGHTNETTFAIIGLTDHLLAAGFAEADAINEYTVVVNGTVVATDRLDREQPAVSLSVPFDLLRPSLNDVRLSHDGEGALYYTISSRAYVPRQSVAASGSIRVSRVYQDPASGERLQEFEAGQLVRVRLTVSLDRVGSYMIIEDRLPGGLEALNEGLNTTSHVARAYDSPRQYWRDLGYNYKEIFDDRVTFFVTELAQGQQTFTYYARATHAGAFTAMPAEVSAMYDPSLWGRSSSHLMVIE